MGTPRLGRVRPLLCVAALLASFSSSWAADKFCVVDAKVKPGARVSLSGDVTVPVPAQLKTLKDTPLYGDVAIVFPTAECPTGAELAAALPDAFLMEPKGATGGMHIDQLSATAEMDGLQLGTISIENQRGFVITPKPFGKSLEPDFELHSVAGKGVVASDIVQVAPMELSTGAPILGSGCVVRGSASGTVAIDCSKMKLHGHIETPEASADIRISGSFLAEGDVAQGRLMDVALFPGAPVPKPKPAPKPSVAPKAAAASGTAAGAAVTCAAGDVKCEQAKAAASTAKAQASKESGPAAAGSGKPGFKTANAATQTEEPAVAPTAAAPTPTAAAAAGAAAPTKAAADAPPAAGAPGPRCRAGSDSSCECEEGWAGGNCVRCTAPLVCPSLTGQLLSTCDTAMEYTSRTAYKAYSCSVKGGLGALVKSITGICNVRGKQLPYADAPLGLQPGATSAAVAPGGAFCTLQVMLGQDPHNPLECFGSACTFDEGKASFTCAKTHCGCPAKGKCMPLVQGILNNMKNVSVGIDCKSSGDCTLTGIQPRLDLACSAGECTQPEAPPAPLPSLSAAPAKPFPTVALVACVAPIVLAAMGGLGLAYVALSGRLFRSGAGRGGGGAGGDDSADGRRGLSMGEHPRGESSSKARPLPQEALGQPVRFEFTGIYCAVPDRGGSGGGGNASAGAKSFTNLADAGHDTPGTPTGRPGTPTMGADAVADAARGLKVLLHGVSGVITQGEVVGVMGPSGAGKSTLLSILSGANESVGAGARVEGSVALGGEARRAVLRRVTAFVPQKDVLLPALTVEECVRYSALLRLPRSLSAEEIQERIDGVLAELGLSHVATSLVGGSASIRGVSGGERRRVTIAMALVTRPRLVIMDEPTSGLDSYTAYNLMRTAQDIARHGRVVVMSLHQPSPDMFDSLSQVLLLAKGRLAYLGPPAGVGTTFAAAGFPCPPGRQPAEHMLHVASQPAGLAALLRRMAPQPQMNLSCTSKGRFLDLKLPSFSKPGAGAKSPAALISVKAADANSASTSCDDEWRIGSAVAEARASAGGGDKATAAGAAAAAGGGVASRQESLLMSQHAAAAAATAQLHGSHLGPHHAQHPLPPPTPCPHGGRRMAAAADWASGKLRECAVLYWRAFTNMRREPRLLMLHIMVALVLGLVVGAVFYKLDTSNVGLQNRLGAMFFALALFGWTSVSVVDGLVLERELVEREVAGHYYGGSTYLMASLVLDGLLLRTLPALLFSALVYPMVGLLPEASRVVTFMFVLATYTCTVGALTTALTALCRTSSATTLAMNIILLMWVLIGGYLVNPNSIPVWLRWVRDLSPLSFAFEVLAANEMADQFFSIKVDGLPSIGGIKGDVFLRTLGLNPSRKLTSAGALAAFYAGSVALAFVAMSYTLWKHSGGTWRSLLCGNGGGDAAACPAGGSGCGGGAAAAGGFGGGAGRVPSAALRSAAEVGAAPQRQARLETASSAHLDD